MYAHAIFTLMSIVRPILTHTIPSPLPHKTSWHSLAPIPISPRQEHSTVFLPPSTIAIIGGVVPTNDTSIVPPFATTSIMQLYSITKNTWSSRALIPTPLNHINAAVVNGKIYLLGGLAEFNDSRGRAWRAIPDCWSYDPATDHWSRIHTDVPKGEERGSAAVIVHDAKIYLAGGATSLEFNANNTQNSISTVSVFDTRTHTWLKVPQAAKYMPGARDHAGAALVDERMYVLGGRDHGQGNVRDTVFVLNLCDLEAGWATSQAKMPTARGGLAASVVGKKVYTFGGEGDTSVASGVFDEVEAYDTVKDRWESVGMMKIPRHGTYAVSVDGKVYIPGGGIQQGGGPVSDFDIFVPSG
jgi:N-acetylneuraminic acid mutarotase